MVVRGSWNGGDDVVGWFYSGLCSSEKTKMDMGCGGNSRKGMGQGERQSVFVFAAVTLVVAVECVVRSVLSCYIYLIKNSFYFYLFLTILEDFQLYSL